MSKAAQLAALIGSGVAQGNKNLIINGAMTVAQRGTSTTGVTNATLLIDRFIATTTSGSIDLSKSTTAPAGFANSFKVAVNTTNAFGTASDEAHIEQKIEAQNLQRLGYGSSTAHKITLSFWVRSSVTGNYGAWFYQEDAGKDYSTSYTISSANTWEKKTITVDGNISNIINNDNGIGMNIRWFLDGGSNRRGTVRDSWLTTSPTAPKVPTGAPAWMNGSNDFYLTGVQLEVGEQATPFEHEPFAVTQHKCFRYYYNSRFGYNEGGAYSPNRDAQYGHVRACIAQFPVKMRATPSVSIQSSDANCMDRFGRGQETCYPKADNIYPELFQNIVKYTNANQTTTTNWQDNGNYINRAGYKADAEL